MNPWWDGSSPLELFGACEHLFLNSSRSDTWVLVDPVKLRAELPAGNHLY